jgi:nucleoid DNA-binding protein
MKITQENTTGGGKMELVKEMAKISKMSPKECAYFYDLVMHAIYTKLSNGQSVYIPRIGRIEFRKAKARTSNMTQTFIPDHIKIRFKAKAEFAKAVRKSSYAT